MLLLVTGAPGASKTSHVIDKFMEEKQRPIFYYNISLNDEGKTKLGWMEFTEEQVLDWQNELPTNAILIVDECQRIWPVRAPNKSVPASCTAMETHRHQGVDIVLITQHPGLIDSHIRKLVNEHYHYSRPFGMPFAVEYHSGSGTVSPDNRTDMAQCTQSKRVLPKRVWPLYKSAEVHTHKAKIPKVVYFVALAALVAIYMIWKFLSSYGVQEEPLQAAQASQTATQQHAGNSSPSHTKTTKEELANYTWAELLTPEIAGVPFTAPLYREEAMRVQDVPRLAGCVAIADKCTCYTQQGTRIADIPSAVCKHYLAAPPFNHMKQPEQVTEPAYANNASRERVTAAAHGEARASAVLVRATPPTSL